VAPASVLHRKRAHYPTDYDPNVLSHARALLSGDLVTVASGDLREPGGITGSAAVRGLIRPDEPTAVILAMVMHFIDAGTAQQVTRELVDWLAPGSYLVISTASGEEEAVASDMQSEYTASCTRNHSQEVIRSFFAGTELMAPGLADAGEWLPGAAVTTLRPKSIRVIAGIGRKP